MAVKSLIKNFIKFIALIVLIIIISISFYVTVRWVEFQKVYNSFDDWKLAHKIEKTLYKMANEVQKTKQPLSINLNELTKERQIDKICVAGPYSRDINEAIGINWKQSKIWNHQVVNYDTLYSIFLIDHNEVIPMKIKINKIKRILINNPCIQVNQATVFELLKNNSGVYLKISK